MQKDGSMKSGGAYSNLRLISVRVLLLVYILICALTVLFSRNFFDDLLVNAKNPPLLQLLVYFTIPVVLLVFLAIYLISMIRDALKQRPGVRLQIRLFANFIIIVALAAAPVLLFTILSVSELARFWPQIKVEAALNEAKNLSVEVFSLQTEKFENYLRQANIDALMESYTAKDFVMQNSVAAVQDFSVSKGAYTSEKFAGDAKFKLAGPPALTHGFAVRELPRDTDVVRYVETKKSDVLRVISFALGDGFDASMQLINTESNRFESLKIILGNEKDPLLFFYIFVFLFPALLITVIIAITFTRGITQPIVDLSEATMQVAQGDFTIQILNHPKDELGALINNFNSMVQNLEKTQNALVRTEKISIWQTMAQQLAHEIKNPLTPIKLSAERVLRRYRAEPEKALEILESSMMGIIQEVESLSTLLNEFKTLSRPIEPSQSTTNIREAVEEIIAPYITSCPKVLFDTSRMYQSVNVKIDRKHLTQVINNLVINSLDAMKLEEESAPSSGKIEFRTDLVNKRQSKYCRLSIQDTGKGIDTESAEKVWTPYWTTKESGTGLGLPIVERIITDHGGGIWFNSAPGEGATFFVDLLLD